MATYVVLLRGVNVGKAKRLPMADLKALLLGLGCAKVTTLLNSGNAVVAATGTDGDTLAQTLAAAILERFGFEVPTIVKSAEALTAIVRGNPWASTAQDHSRLLVVFGRDTEAIASLRPFIGLAAPPERFSIAADAAYLDCPGGLLESTLAATLLGQSGKGLTTRNWATVLKLQALADRSAH